MVMADSPFTAPESTSEPGVLEISNGSPVRYDSSIEPWPETTEPSTGQISCGRTTSFSPITMSASAMSIIPADVLRCAIVGMRRARASSTAEARRVA